MLKRSLLPANRKRDLLLARRAWAMLLYASAIFLFLASGCGLPDRSFGSPSRVARVGVLAANRPDQQRWRAFLEGMRERGWIEGQNLVTEWDISDPAGAYEQLPELASALVKRGVDVIISGETPAVQAARAATDTLPIVMTGLGNPVAVRVVDSLARPGGNVTGVSQLSGELISKRMEVLQQAVPGIQMAVLLLNGSNPANLQLLPDHQREAEAMGLKTVVMDVRSTDVDLMRAIAAAAPGGADGLVVINDALFLSTLKSRVVDMAARARMPAIYFAREFVDAGGLMSYGPSLPALWRRAAYFVDKVLRGTRPADLPVEQPTEFELVVNRTTALELGISISPEVAAQVTEWVR